jgi:hypothetical protein
MPGTSMDYQRPHAAAGGQSRCAVAEPQPVSVTSSGLKEFVLAALGPQTFGIGVTVGIAENLARSVVDLAGLARIFLLADLHDRANGPTALALVGPIGPMQYAAAELAMWQFGDELKQARSDRDALIAEVLYAIGNPGEVFGSIAADYADKWQRFAAHSVAGTLSGTFEAGRIFGDVLVDIVSVIGTGVAVAKVAAKAPRLLALARRSRALAAAGGGGAAPAARPGGAAVTPSQLTGRQPEVIPVERPAAHVPEGTLKGKPVRLEGMSLRDIQYTKRAEVERAALRKEFDGGVRRNFLKSLAEDPEKVEVLKRAGMTDQDVARIASGSVPPGYQVHHKLPLDDGGTNAFDNLVLIQDDPFHKALSNLQREVASSLKPGDTVTVAWPVPDGFVYPAVK